MKKSRLRKKSPVFRQGHRTGYQDGIVEKLKTTGTGDDEATFARNMADADKPQTRNEKIFADRYYELGKANGYDEGYADNEHDAQREKTDLTLAGVVIIALIAAAIGLAIGGVLSL